MRHLPRLPASLRIGCFVLAPFFFAVGVAWLFCANAWLEGIEDEAVNAKADRTRTDSSVLSFMFSSLKKIAQCAKHILARERRETSKALVRIGWLAAKLK